jgi:2'-5' RNA ligase
MRLFVAVDLDEPTRVRVARIIDVLRAGLEVGRSAAAVTWVAPERLHLTLQFIGEVGDDVAKDIAERLRAPFQLAPFEMCFGGMGTFPAAGRPRVAWLGIERGAEALAAVHAEITRRLEGVPFRREARAYSAHLTLARFKNGGTRADRERLAEARLEAAGGCTIDHVTLYQSRLSPRGSTYMPLLATPLRPGPPA